MKYKEKIMMAIEEVFGLEDDEVCVDDYLLLEEVYTDRDLGEYYYYDILCDPYADEQLGYYFNHEAFGRDIRLEADGGFSKYGWIEFLG